MADFAGDVGLHAVGKGRPGVLGGGAEEHAIGARVQHRRRVVGIGAKHDVVVHRVVHLAVDFIEAQVLLDRVAVRKRLRKNAAARRAIEGVAVGHGGKALPARVPVVPSAEVERDWTEGRTPAAVEVDLTSGAVREVDAGATEAEVQLVVFVDVVARLEIRRDRRLVVRLRDTAEKVIAGDRRTEREIPRRGFRRHNRLGFGDKIGRRSGSGSKSKRSDSCDRKLLHDSAPSRRVGSGLRS